MDSQERAQQAPRAPGLSTPRAAGVAGIVFALLFTASILVTRSVMPSASAGFVVTLAGSMQLSGSIVASYLVPFAGIAFLWFIGVVRDRVGALEDKFFATVFLGSGVVFVAMLFSAASVLSALLALDSAAGASYELGRSIARSMFYMYGARSAGVFTLVASTIILRTHALARWVAFAGFVVGFVLLLSVQSFDLIILLFPAWVAVLSILILLSVRRQVPSQEGVGKEY